MNESVRNKIANYLLEREEVSVPCAAEELGVSILEVRKVAKELGFRSDKSFLEYCGHLP